MRSAARRMYPRVRRLLRLGFCAPCQPEPQEQHRDRQQLPRGRAEPEEAEESVGLAEELAEDARAGIADEKDAAGEAGPLADAGMAHEEEHDEEQHQAFERGFVKL